ncbi:MAG: thioredoxin family protein [Archaeoglobaceae archaeon]|nr:thioredoxin family protein [Archaeoglobaceae archaeon]
MQKLYILLLVAGIGILILTLQNHSMEMNSAWLSYEEAVKKSNDTGKMLFVFISSPICPTCREFREFLSREDITKKISEKFLPVYIKDPTNSPVPVISFPTFCIGYPTSLECFYSTSGKSLLEKLGVS